MTAWPVVPGVPAAGHVSTRGFWHPGLERTCGKAPCSRERCPNCKHEGDYRHHSHHLSPCQVCGSDGHAACQHRSSNVR